MKRTAVEWYAMQEAELAVDLGNKKITDLQFIDKKLKILEQALAMEKEQIEDAYQAGQDNVDYTACFVDENGLENYYQKTYGGNNAD